MASDNDSEISDAPSSLTTPFSIAARSNVSSVLARHTRNIATRRPIRAPQLPPARFSHVSTIFEASSSQSSFGTIPTGIEKGTKDAEFVNDEEESSEDSGAGSSAIDFPSQIPDPETGFSQSSATSSKKSPTKTSGIHQHCKKKMHAIGLAFVCNYCSKLYKCSGGTGSMKRHLKERHQINPEANTIALKRRGDGTTVDAAILRGAEINIAAEEKRREELMSIDLDKTTLEYLYLQWTITQDIPFNQVVHFSF